MSKLALCSLFGWIIATVSAVESYCTLTAAWAEAQAARLAQPSPTWDAHYGHSAPPAPWEPARPDDA